MPKSIAQTILNHIHDYNPHVVGRLILDDPSGQIIISVLLSEAHTGSINLPPIGFPDSVDMRVETAGAG